MAATSKDKKKVTKKKTSDKTPVKHPPSKYEEKFKVEGTFEDIIKQLVTPKKG